MYLKKVNQIFRSAILSTYFQPELAKLGYQETNVKHSLIGTGGVSKDGVLHIFFDLETGSEYPDGDEWVIAEYLLPFDVKLPDSLKSPDLFTTLSIGEGKKYWRHRELIRYRSGRAKRLEEARDFIERKRSELYSALDENSIITKLKEGEDNLPFRRSENKQL